MCIRDSENISEALITAIDLGTGVAAARVSLPREMFYRTLSEQSGFDVGDDGDLMSLLTKLASVKAEYDKVAGCLLDTSRPPLDHPWGVLRSQCAVDRLGEGTIKGN